MASNNTENIYSSEYGEGSGKKIPASKIEYDNTESGLTADDVQEAIDEIANTIDTLPASKIVYDNTESGLTADDVQEAIDEIVNAIDINGYAFTEKVPISVTADTTKTIAENMDALYDAVVAYLGTLEDTAWCVYKATIDGRYMPPVYTEIKTGTAFSADFLRFVPDTNRIYANSAFLGSSEKTLSVMTLTDQGVYSLTSLGSETATNKTYEISLMLFKKLM